MDGAAFSFRIFGLSAENGESLPPESVVGGLLAIFGVGDSRREA
jgi:hypothetical protein